jgi:hypothetical protein
MSEITININTEDQRTHSTPSSKDTVWQTGIKKEDLTICCLQETHLIDRNKHGLWVKG